MSTESRRKPTITGSKHRPVMPTFQELLQSIISLRDSNVDQQRFAVWIAMYSSQILDDGTRGIGYFDGLFKTEQEARDRCRELIETHGIITATPIEVQSIFKLTDYYDPHNVDLAAHTDDETVYAVARQEYDRMREIEMKAAKARKLVQERILKEADEDSVEYMGQLCYQSLITKSTIADLEKQLEESRQFAINVETKLHGIAAKNPDNIDLVADNVREYMEGQNEQVQAELLASYIENNKDELFGLTS